MFSSLPQNVCDSMEMSLNTYDDFTHVNTSCHLSPGKRDVIYPRQIHLHRPQPGPILPILAGRYDMTSRIRWKRKGNNRVNCEESGESEAMRWRNCVNCVMALWVMISPWMLRVSHQGSVLASCFIGGFILLAVSLWGAIGEWTLWGIVISAACGIFFVVQPFLGHYTNGAYWAIVVPGIITLFLDFWAWQTYTAAGYRGGGGTRTGP
jgi:hypothetical protein